MTRVSRVHWISAGVNILREHGHEAITVERLCEALGKSKGSFYHHFVDHPAFLDAVLETWESELTERPIAAATEEPDPHRRSARLDRVVQDLDHHLDRAVRAWALRDPRARIAIDRVDARRIDYLTELHRAIGRGAAAARTCAELDYAAFVGIQHVAQLAVPQRAARLNRQLRRALDSLTDHRNR